MVNIRIEKIYGEKIKASVDDFYKKNGSQAVARNDDLFFVAYVEENIVGCVRFCIENDIPMLRTMYIDSACRKQGIGQSLLEAFSHYLEENRIKNVFCLPYSHLENFYGLINFKIVDVAEVPPFLIDRKTNYEKNGKSFLYMRRL